MNKQAYAKMKVVAKDKAVFEAVTDDSLIESYSDHVSSHFENFEIGQHVFVNYSIGASGRRTILSSALYEEDKHSVYFRIKTTLIFSLPEDIDTINRTFSKHWDSTLKRLSSFGANLGVGTDCSFSAICEGLEKSKRLSLEANISLHEVNILSRVANMANISVSVGDHDFVSTNDAEEAEKPKRVPHPATNGYYIDPLIAMVFTTVSNSLGEKPVKTLITGPSGYGKTTLPTVFANILGLDVLRMNCAQIRDPEEWFGYREAIGGETVFVDSPFVEAIQNGNCVVILDEWNRLAPDLKNTLYPLLDDDARTQVHGREVVVGDNVAFFATVNIGTQYVGTYEMDYAELNRFQFISEVGPIPGKEEESLLSTRTGVSRDDAHKIIKTINNLRDKHGDVADFSTRTSIQIAKAVAAGANVRFAFQSVVVNRVFDTGYTSNRKVVIDTINMSLGQFAVSDIKDSMFFVDNKND